MTGRSVDTPRADSFLDGAARRSSAERTLFESLIRYLAVDAEVRTQTWSRNLKIAVANPSIG